MTAIPAPDDLGIRLLMARNGISREAATVMWYAKDLLEACNRAIYHMTLRGWAATEGHELYEVYGDMLTAIRKAEGTRPEEG